MGGHGREIKSKRCYSVCHHKTNGSDNWNVEVPRKFPLSKKDKIWTLLKAGDGGAPSCSHKWNFCDILTVPVKWLPIKQLADHYRGREKNPTQVIWVWKTSISFINMIYKRLYVIAGSVHSVVLEQVHNTHLADRWMDRQTDGWNNFLVFAEGWFDHENLYGLSHYSLIPAQLNYMYLGNVQFHTLFIMVHIHMLRNFGWCRARSSMFLEPGFERSSCFAHIQHRTILTLNLVHLIDYSLHKVRVTA